jgi:hypothetical protein
MHETNEACLRFICGIVDAAQLKNLKDSLRDVPSIQRGARSTSVHYAEYQSLATAEKVFCATRKLTGFGQHSPKAFERDAVCPVKLGNEELVSPLVQPTCEIWGCGLDRTGYLVGPA